MSQKWSTCVSVLKWCKCFFQHTARFLKMVTQSFLEHEIYRQLMRPTWELLQPVNSAQLTYTWPAPFFTTAHQMRPHNVALYFNCPVTHTDVLRPLMKLARHRSRVPLQHVNVCRHSHRVDRLEPWVLSCHQGRSSSSPSVPVAVSLQKVRCNCSARPDCCYCIKGPHTNRNCCRLLRCGIIDIMRALVMDSGWLVTFLTACRFPLTKIIYSYISCFQVYQS